MSNPLLKLQRTTTRRIYTTPPIDLTATLVFYAPVKPLDVEKFSRVYLPISGLTAETSFSIKASDEIRPLVVKGVSKWMKDTETTFTVNLPDTTGKQEVSIQHAPTLCKGYPAASVSVTVATADNKPIEISKNLSKLLPVLTLSLMNINILEAQYIREQVHVKAMSTVRLLVRQWLVAEANGLPEGTFRTPDEETKRLEELVGFQHAPVESSDLDFVSQFEWFYHVQSMKATYPKLVDPMDNSRALSGYKATSFETKNSWEEVDSAPSSTLVKGYWGESSRSVQNPVIRSERAVTREYFLNLESFRRYS